MILSKIKDNPTVLIERLDGTIYDLNELGYPVVSFDPPSSNWNHTFQQVGKYGSRLVDSEIQQLTIPLVFDIKAINNWHLEIKRMELNQIFRSDEEFYVISTKMRYLRWKVVANAFDIKQLDNYHKAKTVSVSLVCAEGFAESIATTLDPLNMKANVWGMEMHIPEKQTLKYVWQTPQIKFFNGSNIPLLAEEHPVKIKFQGVAPNGIKLRNKTTGQEINVYRNLSATDVLIWYGLVPVVNEKQQYGNSLSDHGYLDFAIGWNELELSGAENFEISFETRFYY